MQEMVVKKFVALVAKGVLHTFAGACMASFAYGCYKACTSQFVQDVLRIMEEHRSARKGLPEMYSEVEYVYPYGTPGISDGAWRLHYSKFKRHIIKFRYTNSRVFLGFFKTD